MRRILLCGLLFCLFAFPVKAQDMDEFAVNSLGWECGRVVDKFNISAEMLLNLTKGWDKGIKVNNAVLIKCGNGRNYLKIVGYADLGEF